MQDYRTILFKIPGKSQHICTETLWKLHDNREITMQSQFGFYDNREEHVRSRWCLYTTRAIIQKGSHNFVLALCPLKSMSLSHVAHIASARCPCGHCAMQKQYVNGLWTYTFFKCIAFCYIQSIRALEPKQPRESIRYRTASAWRPLGL